MRLKKECIFWLAMLVRVSSCLNTSIEHGNKNLSEDIFFSEIFKTAEFNVDPYDSYNQDTVEQICLGLITELLEDILASCNFSCDSEATDVTLSWTREVTPKVFQAQHFANLSSVLSLKFDDPFESEFAPNTFQGLRHLKNLEFRSGRKVLPDNLLSWLPQLTSLTIEGPPSQFKIFQNLTNLENISIKVKMYEENDTLPDGLFNNLRNLRILEIASKHPLEITQTRFLHGLKLLERVKIHAHVGKIYNETFHGLENILSINMSGNSLNHIGYNWFESQVNLKELYLDHNRISYIPLAPFHTNRKLEVLDLSHNQISEILGYLVRGLTGLKRIYLNHNHIKFIHPTLFNEANVQNVGENFLLIKGTTSRQIDFYNKNLELIDLRDNLFPSVFMPENDFQNDLTVDLRNNKISWIDIDYLEWLSYHYDVSPFTLRLNQNPLDCNKCDVPNIKTYEKTKRLPMRLEMDNLTCAEPTALQGRLVKTLRKDEMKCPLGEIACPPRCNCSYLPQEQHPRLLFNCSNKDLFEAPKIPEVYSICPSGCSCKFIKSGDNTIFDYSVDCRSKEQTYAPINETEPECPKACSCSKSYPTYTCDLDSFSKRHGNPLQSCPASCQCEFKQSSNTTQVNVMCGKSIANELPTLTGLFASNCIKRMLPQPHLMHVACPSLGRNLILNFGHSDLSIELDLSRNKLNVFPKMDRGGYQNVSNLNLNANHLDFLDGSDISQSLVSLRLDQNRFQKLETQAMSRLEGLKELYLGANDWICECSETELYNFTRTVVKKRILADVSHVNCSNGVPLMDLEKTCVERKYSLRVSLAIAVCLIITVLTMLCALISHRIKLYLYSKGLLWWLISEDDLDKDKIYDAFISYSHADETFVEETLVPKLESGDQPYKLCVHVRDWELGKDIAAQIRTSISQSRRTVIVLSKKYLQSCWARMEFRAAHTNAINERRINGVFAILMDDKREIEEAGDREFKAYVNTNTYLHKDDPYFWKKLRIALRCPLSVLKNKAQTIATTEASV